MSADRARHIVITQKRTLLLSNPHNMQAQQQAEDPEPPLQYEDVFGDSESEAEDEGENFEGESEDTYLLVMSPHRSCADSGSEDESPFENFVEPHEPHDARTEEAPSVPRNKFMFALTSAAEAYASRFRNRLSTVLTPSTPLQLLPPDLADSSTPEFIDDDSDSESGFSSEDEQDRELFMNRAKISMEEAEKLFYNPLGPWASVSNEPIENPVVIAKLHCKS